MAQRVPSVKRLVSAFKLPKDLAQQLHDKMVACGPDRDVERFLDATTEIIGGFGSHEVISPSNRSYRGYWMGAALAYINMGDPYTTTIYYEIENDAFSVGAWGDWLEAAERRGLHFD
jgi:hypothetical protein